MKPLSTSHVHNRKPQFLQTEAGFGINAKQQPRSLYHYEIWCVMYMRNILSCMLLAVCGLLLVSCDEDGQRSGNGRLEKMDFDLANFSAVAAETGYQVEILPDTGYAVSVTTDENLMDLLNVYRENETLYLKLKPHSNSDFTMLRAEVRMPQISALVLSSGANAVLREGFSSSLALSVVLSAGSSVEGAVSSGNLSCVLNAGSHLELAGAGQNGSLIANAGSYLDLRAYPLQNVSIFADGGSAVYVHCTGVLSVTASGGSRVYYTGSPQFGTLSITGGSTLQQLP